MRSRRTGGSASAVTGFVKENILLAAVIPLLLIPALLDITVVARATDGMKNTVDALFGLFGVLVTAGLVNLWQKRRADRVAKERFEGIAGVAFRSLAQAANDAGRILLAPVLGANLHDSAIPGFTEQHHEENLCHHHAVSLISDFKPTGGVWDDSFTMGTLKTNLAALCARPEFRRSMFRTISTARRRLHESIANWAPVMVEVPGAYDHLRLGWVFADQTVALLETWRQLSTTTGPLEEGQFDRLWRSYSKTVDDYQAWIKELVPLSRLPD